MHKGFATITIVLAVLAVLVLGVVGYVAMNPQLLQMLTDAAQNNENTPDSKTSITWQFTDAGEVDGVPYTSVVVAVNGSTYEMGKFAGSCSELGANGGIDGKGLLAGELSAAQCWFAGGGNELGVFAHEDGGFDLMVGELSEGEVGTGLFRGDFKIKHALEF